VTPAGRRTGDLLGYATASYFVNVRLGPRRGEYGNAILSRLPIIASSKHRPDAAAQEARSVLHAETAHGAARRSHPRAARLQPAPRTVGRERHEQLRRFLACEPFARLRPATPILVAGDFNDVWHARPAI